MSFSVLLLLDLMQYYDLKSSLKQIEQFEIQNIQLICYLPTVAAAAVVFEGGS